jgi:hypothetical protein
MTTGYSKGSTASMATMTVPPAVMPTVVTSVIQRRFSEGDCVMR